MDKQTFIKAADLIKQFEGFSPSVYNDSGKPAIGYGVNLTQEEYNAVKGKTITQEQATALLYERMSPLVSKIRDNTDALSSSQYQALLSFGYNAGQGALEKALTVLRDKGSSAAADYISRYIYSRNSNGELVVNHVLADRRQKEAAMLLDGSSDYERVASPVSSTVVKDNNTSSTLGSLAQMYDTSDYDAFDAVRKLLRV